MSSGKIFHEINAFVEKFDGSKLLTLSNSDVYTDHEFDFSEIDCDFQPHRGDRVKLFIITSKPPQVSRIHPWEALRTQTGKITYLTKSFGVVDEEIVFFQMDKIDWEAKKDDEVECIVIEGEYNVGKTKYEMRCESIKKCASTDIDPTIFFEEGALKAQQNLVQLDLDNVDSDENDNEPQMQFEAYQKKEPNKEFYDLPYGLYDSLTSKNVHQIKKQLDELVPSELNYNTYKRHFHALIYLEEIEMKISFEKYKSREVWIEPEKKRFSIQCSKITELRPPIAVGDKIEVRKIRYPKRYYRGTVERVLEDRFILRFKEEFSDEYEMGEKYSAEFFYNRTIFQRKHAAIEYGKRKLDEAFLFPTKMVLAKTIQLNAELKENHLILDEIEVPWFKENLNDEQKQSVVGALRGECRPLPYIIFGPPGTGKTSTLIEIILQLFTHAKDCQILVATQSNHAANVVASRLITSNTYISTNLIRLVSNAVLDRKTLPKDLHKVSCSVQNTNIENDLMEYGDQPIDVKRNVQLEYLKNYKIVIGTCVGLGVLFGSDMSNGYFTHVLIDEAAQCNECEALIPISFINLEVGQIIMAGDPLQLSPITLSNHTKHYDLIKSMLERYVLMYKNVKGANESEETGNDPRLVTKLRRNYRSLPCIMNYYNKQFYESQLIATLCPEDSQEAEKLRELSRILPEKSDPNRRPFGICFVNVEGRNERMENKKSWENKEEASIIKSYIPKLLERKIPPEDIGIITPYHAQVLLLQKELKHFRQVRIGTVEEFQGEEKNVIIISAVKTSGKNRALEFIYCQKRLNTAISRARMLVIIFGRVSLLGNNQNWADLIEYCKKNESFIEGKNAFQM